jgi:hypothetical protein
MPKQPDWAATRHLALGVKGGARFQASSLPTHPEPPHLEGFVLSPLGSTE